MTDTTGFAAKPDRYNTESGREAIDIIRDSMSDEEFGVWCRGQALKYQLRLGKKPGTDDAEKARWYTEMAAHVLTGNSPDPRAGRADFEPYHRASAPEPLPGETHAVLDHGFVRLVEAWGQGDARIPEAGIIEAARQSTQGSFRGWRRDKQLLRYLYEHKHNGPFEFAGMTLEIQAPIFVFRQWMRHRTQSYNEASARYTELPDLHYVPTIERVMMDGGANKQAQGERAVSLEWAQLFVGALQRHYESDAQLTSIALRAGVPKELARLHNTVGRYSRMRASANLRNWLGFLTLRMDPHAQWETRQYANAVFGVLQQRFPYTADLFRPNPPGDL